MVHADWCVVASWNPVAFEAWLSNSPGQQTAEFKFSPSDEEGEGTKTTKDLGSAVESVVQNPSGAEPEARLVKQRWVVTAQAEDGKEKERQMVKGKKKKLKKHPGP